MRREDESIGRSAIDELDEMEREGEQNEAIEDSYNKGFNDCKRQVLQILKKDWTGLDMSINSCDQYYIDKVKSL